MIPRSAEVKGLQKELHQMKSLEQEVRSATDDQVNASRLRVRTESQSMDATLNKFTLSEHITIISLLETMVKHRQQEMQLAAAEMQRQHGMKQQEAQDTARAAMQQDQAKIKKIREAEPVVVDGLEMHPVAQ